MKIQNLLLTFVVVILSIVFLLDIKNKSLEKLENSDPVFEINSDYTNINGKYYTHNNNNKGRLVYNNPDNGKFMFFNSHWESWIIMDEFNTVNETTPVGAIK